MSSAPPLESRYRRRFLVEFTPAESDLVERLGRVHGTKRRAILEGLAALDSGELAALRARAAELEGQLTAAAATASDARAAVAAAKVELRDERSAHRQTKARLREAQRQVAVARADLAAARAARDRLTVLVPHHAYCAACEKLVPEAEWAEQPMERGVVVFHRPHGYRPKRTLTQSPSVLFWRATGAGQDSAR